MLRAACAPGLLALTLALSAGQAHASATSTLKEVGADVVMTGSGSLNLAGFTFAGLSTFPPFINPGGAFLVGAAGTSGIHAGAVTGLASFGPATTTPASSGTGDPIALDFSTGGLGVPTGYVSGAALSGNATYLGRSFSSLGATPGTCTRSLRNGDTVSPAVGNAVPEPSTLLLGASAAC